MGELLARGNRNRLGVAAGGRDEDGDDHDGSADDGPEEQGKVVQVRAGDAERREQRHGGGEATPAKQRAQG